ncbi:Dienelactone hydrolase [Mycena kentingensis (nom. inval.)]|nr:Dienelactone hydrolase [Mycena kentingensis (nom. inval.)]
MGGVFSSASDLSSTEISPSSPNAASLNSSKDPASASSSIGVALSSSNISIVTTSRPSMSTERSDPVNTQPNAAAPSTTVMSASDKSTRQPAASSVSFVSPSSRSSTAVIAPVKSSASVKSTVKLAEPTNPPAEATKPISTTHSSTVSFTATSTITDPPESTLNQPVFVSVIASDGKPSSTAPPLVTFLSTSTQPDGNLVTFTHVVANPNPTAFVGSQALEEHTSFFNNSGAVAGVFLVVGAILTGAIVFGLFICCRKQRRKREEHRRWLVSMHRPRPLSDNDAFMVERSYERYEGPWDGRVRSPTSMSDTPVGPGHYKVSPPRRVQPNYDFHEAAVASPGPSSDVGSGPLEHKEVGLAITTDEQVNRPSAQSSPSIYPASLAPVEDNALPEPIEPLVLPPPPRPRRSHLRNPSLTKTTQLVTPPSSDGTDRGNKYKIEKSVAAYDEDATLSIDLLASLSNCNGRIAATGMCLGGHLAFRAAFDPRVLASVCFFATDIHSASLGKGGDDSLVRVNNGELASKGELMIFGKQDTHVPRSGRDLIRKCLEDANVAVSFLEVQAQHAFIRDDSSKGRWDAALTRSLFAFMMEVFERTVGRDLGPRINSNSAPEHVC